MTYGGLSSLANILGAAAGSELSPKIEQMATEADFDPSLAKALGLIVPTAISAGVGYGTGGKYGLLNALPAAAMAGMRLYGSNGSSAQKPEVNEVNPGTQGPKLGEQNPSVPGYFNKEYGDSMASVPDAVAKEGSQTTQVAQAPQGTASKTGGIPGMMDTPEGRMMIGLILSNLTSGVASNESSSEYQYNQQQKAKQDLERQRAAERDYISGVFNRANGGFLNNEPVDQLYPQAMMEEAHFRSAASPQRHEVIHQYFKGGGLTGPGDGMSDSIEASVDGKQKAKVASGEFVVPKEAAMKYGKKLDTMMRAVRSKAHPKKGQQVVQDAAKREFIRHLSGVKA